MEYLDLKPSFSKILTKLLSIGFTFYVQLWTKFRIFGDFNLHYLLKQYIFIRVTLLNIHVYTEDSLERCKRHNIFSSVSHKQASIKQHRYISEICNLKRPIRNYLVIFYLCSVTQYNQVFA